LVRRYVAFAEVEVTPDPDGRAAAALRLAGGEGPFEVELRWLRRAALVITTGRVRRGA
jgi:hypothetical protein